jgi:hypothetical protein
MPAKITRSAKPAPKKRPTFPIRKPTLVRAADATVQPINTGKVKVHDVGPLGYHGIWWAQKIAFGALLLTAIAGAFLVHRTLALAEVGAMTCSDTSSLMWVREDPGSSVPELNNAVMMRCARAYRPFE